MDHVSFDLETTGTDVFADRITCGATREVVGDSITIKLWHSELADVMSDETATELAEYLIAAHERNLPVVSFNGAKFDFAILAQRLAPCVLSRLKEVTKAHIDIMFHFACTHGYYASMDSFAKGCGLQPKTWNGKDAAEAWTNNNDGDRQKVVDYCAEDVRCLSDLYTYIKANGEANRITKAGNLRCIPFAPLFNVKDAAAYFRNHPPDVTWMSDPAPNVAEGLQWCQT